MVKFEWADAKKKTTRLVKKDEKKDKIKYILIGIAIGIVIGIVVFYILMSFGIIRPFFRGFMGPGEFPRTGNFTRPKGFVRQNGQTQN